MYEPNQGYKPVRDKNDQTNAVKIQFLTENFIDKTIRLHHFGLTLFGNKPMSFRELVAPDSENLDNFPSAQEASAAKQLLPIFNSSSHILKIDQSPEPGIKSVYLINKQALRKVIKKEIDMFRDNISSVYTESEIYSLILNSDDVMKALNYRHDLMGIICGNTRDSCMMFQRLSELKDIKLSGPEQGSIAKSDATPSGGYQSAQAELDDINRNSQILTSGNLQSYIIRPMTLNVSRFDTEAEALLDYYAQLERQIEKLTLHGKVDFKLFMNKLSL